jgi:hypothetical protein
LYFGALTLPHDLGDLLEPMRRLVTTGYRRILQGREWLKLKKRLGIVGYVRALEVMAGPNGWHPHAHPLWFTEHPLTPEQVAELDAYVFRTWRRVVVAAGYRAPQRDGFRLDAVRTPDGVANYLAKLGLALELTHGTDKQGRQRGHRSPFQILSDFLATGDDADLTLWLEYERAMKGARRLTFSNGLKDRYGVAEISDEDLATKEVGGELVASLTADEWRAVVAHGVRLAVLEAAEGSGAAGVSAVLASLPTPAPPLRLVPDDGGSG